MNPQPLSQDELAILNDHSDITILEIIKGMSEEEMEKFDVYFPKDFTKYIDLQIKWIKHEIFLIQNRPDHDANVSNTELCDDMLKYHNPTRFRVFYVLKYPNEVIRTKNN